MTDLAEFPGYRRTVRITATAGDVLAELEDDFHCMAVRLLHDGERVRDAEAIMRRVPWTTCPGAAAQLRETMTGQTLADITPRLEKARNCTHLHDLAVAAALHAGERGGACYAMAASDPVAGRQTFSIACNGVVVHRWEAADGIFTAPPAMAGLTAHTLREGIARLPAEAQRAARLLQVAAVISAGRSFPWEKPEGPEDMPAVCYTWQPDRARQARRFGPVFDFSRGGRQPLE